MINTYAIRAELSYLLKQGLKNPKKVLNFRILTSQEQTIR